MSSSNNNTPSSTDMEYYYKTLYPFKQIFQWLNHKEDVENVSTDIINREFAMAFRSGAYKRYNSVNSMNEFKDMVIKFNPDRFEIGAIYNKPPKDRDLLLKTELKPLLKELVFDIDMDDYDSFRTCCSKASVCNKCWKFISLAIKVMNISLKEDFGFNEFVWVFSGRRGAHCWISDERALKLNDLQRRSILDYLNVIRDRTNEKRLNLKRPYHPHLQRSLDLLKPYFTSIILEEQDPWQDDQNAVATLLTSLHERQLIENLKDYWLNKSPNRTSLQKWNDIDRFASQLKFNSNLKKKEFLIKLHDCKEDIVMLTLYPKLDVEVTKQTIHLLKAPFCIHPATGNVCVPIDESFFTPDKAPKLITIQNERENGNSTTSLDPFIEYFRNYVNKMFKNTTTIKNENTDENEKKRSFDSI